MSSIRFNKKDSPFQKRFLSLNRISNKNSSLSKRIPFFIFLAFGFIAACHAGILYWVAMRQTSLNQESVRESIAVDMVFMSETNQSAGGSQKNTATGGTQEKKFGISSSQHNLPDSQGNKAKNNSSLQVAEKSKLSTNASSQLMTSPIEKRQQAAKPQDWIAEKSAKDNLQTQVDQIAPSRNNISKEKSSVEHDTKHNDIESLNSHAKTNDTIFSESIKTGNNNSNAEEHGNDIGNGSGEGQGKGTGNGIGNGASAGEESGSQNPVTIPESQIRYKRRPQPIYPPLSRRKGEEGSVILRVLVNTQGHVQKVEIQHSSGYPRLDSAAENAIYEAAFHPYQKNGVSKTVWTTATIYFRLTNN